jgi:AcrR family transcriptional regulator
VTDVSSEAAEQSDGDKMSAEISLSAGAAGSSRRPRSTQAERSAETRNKLVSATIDCLHEVGYGLTTVSLVAEKAGVSRGALTHQFPSKIDLMLAVVRFVYDSDAAQYRLLLGDKPPKDSIAYLPEAMWEVLSRPSAIAVIEIMLASRADTALMEQLRIMQSEIDVEAGRAMIHRFKAAGLQDRTDGAAIHRMFVSAVRGLAIENLSMGERANVAASIKVLSEVMTLLYPQLRG